MSDLTDAIGRLAQVGSEDARVTQKLRAAVLTVAQAIALSLPKPDCQGDGHELTVIALPRGYFIDEAGCLWDADPLSGYGEALCDTDPLVSRAACLKFAHDIKAGWLGELTLLTQRRVMESLAATVTLENTAKSLGV